MSYADVKEVIALVGLKVKEGSLVVERAGPVEPGNNNPVTKEEIVGNTVEEVDTVQSTNKDRTVDNIVEEVTTLVGEGGQRVVVHWGQQQHHADGCDSPLIARSLNRQERSTAPVVTAVRNNQGNTIQGGQEQDTFIDLTLDTGVVLESGDQVQERLTMSTDQKG